jgi:hypothetical protein
VTVPEAVSVSESEPRRQAEARAALTDATSPPPQPARATPSGPRSSSGTRPAVPDPGASGSLPRVFESANAVPRATGGTHDAVSPVPGPVVAPAPPAPRKIPRGIYIGVVLGALAIGAALAAVFVRG